MTESYNTTADHELQNLLNLATASWRMDLVTPGPLHAKLRFVSSLLSAVDAPIEVPSLLYRKADDQPVLLKEIGESLTVGRSTDKGWTLTQEGRMSRSHFRVFRKDGAWWIEDAGSKNGTFLEGRRDPVKTHAIVSGDVIFAGGARFAFVLPES